jgi:hypothetical protein
MHLNIADTPDRVNAWLNHAAVLPPFWTMAAPLHSGGAEGGPGMLMFSL